MQIVICTAYSDHSWEDMLSRLRHSHQWLILKKPFDNIEVLQTEQPAKRQRRLIRRPATGRLAESPALWRRRRAAPASSAAKPSRPRSRPFAEHVAKAPPGG